MAESTGPAVPQFPRETSWTTPIGKPLIPTSGKSTLVRPPDASSTADGALVSKHASTALPAQPPAGGSSAAVVVPLDASSDVGAWAGAPMLMVAALVTLVVCAGILALLIGRGLRHGANTPGTMPATPPDEQRTHAPESDLSPSAAVDREISSLLLAYDQAASSQDRARLTAQLGELGVERLRVERGEQVDSARHNVVSADDYNSGEAVVVHVVREGWCRGGQVLRPADVTAGDA